MGSQSVVETVPAFLALDSAAVLAGQRRGTSVQLDDSYFLGQQQAIAAAAEDESELPNANLEARMETIQSSLTDLRTVDIEIDSLTETALRRASSEYRKRLQELPEVDFLKHHYPGQCFVVPEWLQTGKYLNYGARVYFIDEEDPVNPDDVIEANIESVLNEARDEFELYQGQLHGYPECCIEAFQDRSPEEPPPEWRSILPFADSIDEAALGGGPSVSIDDIVEPFEKDDERYAFFTREFFPEPGCGTAATLGQDIYDALCNATTQQLSDDYFRLTFGYDYLVALSVLNGDSERPRPGTLGREHLLYYLPLRDLQSYPRYE